jgi:hypothetical protein
MKMILISVLIFSALVAQSQGLDTATEWAIRVKCVIKGTQTPVEGVDVQIHQVSNDSLVGGDYTNSKGQTHFMVVKKGRDYYINTSKEPYQKMNSYLFDLEKTKTGAVIETIEMEYPVPGGVDTSR